MSKRKMRTLVVLVLALFVSYASAVEILWEEPVSVESADILLVPDSEFVHAGSWGHSGFGTVTVVVGGEEIVFNGTSDPEVSMNNTDGTNAAITAAGQNANAQYFAGDTGNAEFNTVLKSFGYDGANPKVLTIKGLEVGQGYHIQLFVGDTRGCCGGRTQFWSDNASKGAGNESTTFSHNESVCTMGTFVADAETVEIYGHGAGQSQQILNCYQLRKAGKRETAAVIAPADGVEDLPRDGVELEWIPGAFAVESDIYLGTDFDEVNDATVDSAVYVERATETTYALDRLTLGATYFWRIDGINDANANSPWKGDVWSFEIEPEGYPVDVALLSASASGNLGAGPEVVVNGAGLSADGTHDTDSENNMWMTSASTPGEGWLQIDMNEPVKLAGLHIWNHNSTNEKGVIAALHMGVKDVLIEYSLDGEIWVSAGIVELAQAPGSADYKGEMVSLGNVYAKSVKLSIQSGYGLLGFAGLSEVQLLAVPTVAREMTPAEGATVNPVDVVLSWRAGRDAATHQVYVSTDPNAVLDETAAMVEVTEPMLAPDVSMDMTYYWKVVEVNELETPSRWAGPVQSFVTQNSIVVDDMESYPTDDELQIWQAWADGYENSNKDNGSIVGDASGLPERTIVYQGSQSLNIQYGANSQPDSWATHTFESAADWTKHNIKSLSLKVYGSVTNQVGEFYVLINDTRFVYEGAADDMKAGQWLTFTIALDNATDVETLTVGIKGGYGTVYVDDIRLYPLPSEMVTPVQPGTDNLQMKYTFDGNFDDSSGNGHHGTALGDAAIATDSTRGQVLNLDGFGDAIEIALVEKSPAFTVAMWVNLANENLTGYNNVYGTNGWYDDSIHFRIFNGLLSADLYGLGGITGSSLIPSNEWIHVAYTMERSEIEYRRYLYLNGIQEAVRVQDVDPENLVSGDIGGALIGAWKTNGGDVDRGTTGRIDDVYIYNTALTAGEVAGLAERTEPFYKPLP